MSGENSTQDRIAAKSLIEKVSELTSTAVLEASRAMEAEGEAMRQVEAAYRRANHTASEVRRAIKSEASAKTELGQARQRAREALSDARKAGEVEARAEREAQRRNDKVKAILAKLTKAEQRGKRPDLTARDQARGRADAAEQRATKAHRAADQVRETLASAERDVEAGKKKALEASAWIRTCKSEEAAAWGKVAHTEDDARKAMIDARQALKSQTGAKQTLDLTIRRLKSVMRDEARAALAAETAQTRPDRVRLETQGETTPTAGIPINQADTPTRQRPKTVHLEWAVSSIARRPYQEAAGAITAPAHRVVRKLKALTRLREETADIREVPAPRVGQGPSQADGSAHALSGEGGGNAEEQAVVQPASEATGNVLTVLVKGPTDLARIKKLRTQLEETGDCRVKSVAGSSSGGTSIAAQADQPASLAVRLRELEFVEWVAEKGKDIEVTFKPFSETSAPQEQGVSSVASAPGPLAEEA